MARAAFRNKDLARGVTYARHSIDREPSSAAYLVLGDLLYVQRIFAEGIASWRTALTLDPANRTARSRLVRHYSSVPAAARPVEFEQWQRESRSARGNQGKGSTP